MHRGEVGVVWAWLTHAQRGGGCGLGVANSCAPQLAGEVEEVRGELLQQRKLRQRVEQSLKATEEELAHLKSQPRRTLSSSQHTQDLKKEVDR